HKRNIELLKKEKYKEEMEKLIYNQEFDMDIIYNYNYYIIDEIYNKFKDKYDYKEDELYNFFRSKYDDYFYRYIDLVKQNKVESELRVYLYNSLNNSFKASLLPVYMTDELKKEKEYNKQKNTGLIYKVMSEYVDIKYHLEHEIYEELLIEYNTSSELYYTKQRLSSYIEYVERRLVKKARELNDLRKEKDLNRIKNIKLIYKVMMDYLNEDKYLDIQIYEELLKEFEESTDMYYKHEIKSDYERFIWNNLVKKVKELKGDTMNIYNGLSIEETLKLSSQDSEAKKAIYDYYKKYYIEKCIKYNGVKYIPIATKIYDDVFNHYFNNNLTVRISNYFSDKAEYLKGETLINNLNIEELILLGKINNAARKKLSDYYKEYYIEKCIKYNGVEGRTLAFKTYDKVLNDFFRKNNLKNLNIYLESKSKIAAQLAIMNTENDKQRVKKHYLERLEKEISRGEILTDQEIHNLCYNFINGVVMNYDPNTVKSNIHVICNENVVRFLNYCKNEEKLLLYYVKFVGISEKVIDYYMAKCKKLKNKYNISDSMCEEIIINILSNGKILEKNIYKSVESEIKRILRDKKNKQQVEIDKILNKLNDKNDISEEEILTLKNYYSQIKKDIYDKYKDKVTISKNSLKDEIDKKYDMVIDRYISNFIKNGIKSSIPKYVRSSLYNIFDNDRYYILVYKDRDFEELKEDRKRVNRKIVDKYIDKYTNKYGCIFTDEDLEKILEEYDRVSDLYYERKRKIMYEDYIKLKVREIIKEQKHI
ncbi:MAG: hypothetical protein IJ094_09990, partial [Bacilli bacterium]|nr:hypothetical protein [Bacilli bacterium]